MMQGQGMPPQITPQMIQQYMQMMNQQQGQPQGQSPQGMTQPQPQQQPQPPMPAPGQGQQPPPVASPQINPNMAAFLQQQHMQGQQPPQQQMNPQMMQQMMLQRNQQAAQMLAQQGRRGDTALAHMTPGEIAVPPEVQTPKVLATLKAEYAKKGVHPAQFQVGNPASSVNPATGTPEYNFMSSFLPMALGIGGALLAPETGGLSLGLSDAAAAGVLGGAGTAAGGLLTGQSGKQALTSGALSGLGGYALSGIGGGAGDVAAKGAGVAPGASSAAASSAADATAGFPGYANAGHQILGSQALGSAFNGFNPGAAVGSGIGSYFANQINQQPKNPQVGMTPAGYNTPLKTAGQLPSFQNQLGYNTYNGPTANFNGYNPATNNPGAWNFYGT